MGQIDIACRDCHKLIWQFQCDDVSGYWAFVVVCGKCEGGEENGNGKKDDDSEVSEGISGARG